MSDVDTSTNEVGYINVKITEHDVMYESEFSVPEVLFWLDILKAMILNRVMNQENE